MCASARGVVLSPSGTLQPHQSRLEAARHACVPSGQDGGPQNPDVARRRRSTFKAGAPANSHNGAVRGCTGSQDGLSGGRETKRFCKLYGPTPDRQSAGRGKLYGPGGSHETPSPLRACGAGGAQRKSRATKRGRGCFVNPAVDDDQSKSADAVDDASGPFVHACYCGRWGFFGYEVALLKDRTGTWFCAEHRPGDDDQSSPRAPP